jgi:predicted MFS family arabinose efflux permease
MVASIFYAYQYILRVMPSIMMTDIMHKFDIDAAAFGQFSGIYYIGYSLLHLPIGIMLDRFGPKRIMTGCILLTVLGVTPIIFADKWIYPVLGRALIGIGSSAAILGTFKIIRMSFTEQKFTRMLSLSVTIGLFGAIYGGAPLSYLCITFGYVTVVKILALMGVALAAITYCIVPEMPRESDSTVVSDIKQVLSNSRVLMACIFAGLMVGPLEGFADVWGTQFLKQVYGYDNALASSLPSLIFIGMCFGAPILSLVAEKTNSYLGTIIGAGLAMMIAFAMLIMMKLSALVVGFAFIIVGVCSAYQILAIFKASTYVPNHVAGLTTAMANMIIMVFGYMFHTVIGSTVAYMGGTQNAEAFTYGIAVVPIALALGVFGFCYLLLKEPVRVLQPE